MDAVNPKTSASEAVSAPIAAEEKQEIVARKSDAATETTSREQTEKENELAKIEWEKRYDFIKAWEANEKARLETKTHKKLSALGSWQINKKASLEAQMSKHEEKCERKKVEFAEKMKNKIANLHKEAEERKKMLETKRVQKHQKVQETAAKYHSLGFVPKGRFICFTG